MSGHQVRVTDEPQVIFELSRAGEVDIILMDVNLPEAFWKGEKVSGTDLSRLLKTDIDTANIAIIILTAYAMANEHKALMVESQADDFFAKPIRDYAVLIEAIERLVNN